MNPIQTKRPVRSAILAVLDFIQSMLAAVGAFFLLTTFVIQPFVVAQTSMSPTLDPGEYLMVDKLSPRWDPYHRGDIVIFHQPETETGDGTPYVKRVIGIPGDVVRITDDGRVAVTPAGGDTEVILEEPYIVRGPEGGPAATRPKPADEDTDAPTEWVVPPGHYFVLGDNRPVSVDGRRFGPIPADTIIGRAWVRYFPFWRASFIERAGTVAALDAPPAP